MSHNQDYDHFGHRHTLVPLVLENEENLTCKACELLINHPFHGCISCAYYLHDRCLHAPRSLRHAAHPVHPLTLLPAPTYSGKEFVCEACRSTGRSFSYSCCHCGFDVHPHCAFLPETASLPEKHPHALKLAFGFENEEKTVFLCDVCEREVDEAGWRYYCDRDGCDFGTHPYCSGVSYQERAGDGCDFGTHRHFSGVSYQERVGDGCDPGTHPHGSGVCYQARVGDDGGETDGVDDTVAAMRQATKEMMELQLATARMQNSLNLTAAYANVLNRW